MKKIKRPYLYAIITILVTLLAVPSFITIENKRLEYSITSGDKYLSEGDYDNAQSVFNKVLKSHEDNIEALLGNGKAYLLQGDYDRAEELFKKAVENDKEDKNIYIRLENIYEENNRLDDAMNIVKLGYSNTGDAEFQNRLKEIKGKLEVPLVEMSIKQGSSYELSKNVKIKVNGEEKELPFAWNTGNVDTNKVGEFIIEGVNEQYDRAAKVTLKIIAYIKAVEDINIDVNQGDKYSLPTAVLAKMSDGSESEFNITWNSTTVDTSKPGSYAFEGTVKEYDKAVKLNLQVKEVIKPISDKEILSLVINAHNSLMEVIDDYKGQDKVDLFTFNDNTYIALPNGLNTYNKLYAYFNKYWSAEASKQLIRFLDVKDRNGIYSRRFGEIGLGYFNTKVAKIVSKSIDGKKITVKINSVDSVNEPTQFKAELIYTGGKWWVNYWQWAFELLG